MVAERVRQGLCRASAREHAFRNERGSKCYRACFAFRLSGASATEHALQNYELSSDVRFENKRCAATALCAKSSSIRPSFFAKPHGRHRALAIRLVNHLGNTVLDFNIMLTLAVSLWRDSCWDDLEVGIDAQALQCSAEVFARYKAFSVSRQVSLTFVDSFLCRNLRWIRCGTGTFCATPS